MKNLWLFKPNISVLQNKETGLKLREKTAGGIIGRCRPGHLHLYEHNYSAMSIDLNSSQGLKYGILCSGTTTDLFSLMRRPTF